MWNSRLLLTFETVSWQPCYHFIFWRGGRAEVTPSSRCLSYMTHCALVTVVDIIVDWEERIRLSGFGFFNMRKAFVLALGEKENTQPSCIFVKLEGAFCFVNYPEIYLGFDLVMTHACLSVPAVWHFFLLWSIWGSGRVEIRLSVSCWLVLHQEERTTTERWAVVSRSRIVNSAPFPLTPNTS